MELHRECEVRVKSFAEVCIEHDACYIDGKLHSCGVAYEKEDFIAFGQVGYIVDILKSEPSGTMMYLVELESCDTILCAKEHLEVLE